MRKETINEKPVEFVVTFSGHFTSEDDNLWEFFSMPAHVRKNVLYSQLCSQTARDEHGCRQEEWIFFVRREAVDALEQAIALCPHATSYERSFLPGDCARIKTFFPRRYRAGNGCA